MFIFSSNDFEKCWFLFQSEGFPRKMSIEEFCLKQGVPFNEFNKWNKADRLVERPADN